MQMRMAPEGTARRILDALLIVPLACYIQYTSTLDYMTGCPASDKPLEPLRVSGPLGGPLPTVSCVQFETP
jgi:hypothetical protein